MSADRTFDDFVRAPNQADDPDLYEVENRAVDPDGHLWRALREAAPWQGKTLLDLGCGSGYWLPHYGDAAEVLGVEPDPDLLEAARSRPGGATVLRGSAEHLPLDDAAVDVVHARFAYFFPHERFDPGPGLAEVARVLKPGGRLVVIDNDTARGEFAELLRRSDWAEAQGRTPYPTRWWAERGATTIPVLSAWRFTTTEDCERVLRLEFPADVVDAWWSAHGPASELSYGYLLHVWTAPA